MTHDQTPANQTDDLADLIVFVRDRWSEAPSQMHTAGVEPDSEFGASRWNEGWRRWVSGIGNYSAVTTIAGKEERLLRCDHRDEDCPDCRGTGQLVMTRGIYRWPDRVAMYLIGDVRVPKYMPRLDTVVFILATSDWSLEALIRITSPRYPKMGFDTFARAVARRALAQFRSRYQTTTRWKPVPASAKSESQHRAEEAA